MILCLVTVYEQKGNGFLVQAADLHMKWLRAVFNVPRAYGSSFN